MEKVFIQKSIIQGKGIFAKKFIRKGEVIFITKGKIIEDRTPKQMGSRWLGISKYIWINPFKSNPFYHINHSCNPNAGIKGRVTFIALKNIKKNEEVTFDYSISEGDTLWKMKCRCGQKGCRKIIRSIQFLPHKTFKKYLPYIPAYFQKAYMKYRRSKFRKA